MITQLTLPDLSYTYDALEPWCEAETLHLHHDKHHRAYVDAGNQAREGLQVADPGDSKLITALTAARTFNVAGHVLHSLFWTSIGPAQTSPQGDLAIRIRSDFGSLDRMQELLVAGCMSVKGSGWGVLSVEPGTGCLQVGALHDHQGDHMPSSALLAVVDVWEHAYYLQYRADRASWVKAAVAHLDWSSIQARFETAASVTPS